MYLQPVHSEFILAQRLRNVELFLQGVLPLVPTSLTCTAADIFLCFSGGGESKSPPLTEQGAKPQNIWHSQHIYYEIPTQHILDVYFLLLIST